MKVKKIIVLGAVLLSIISVVSFAINGIKINRLVKETKEEIELEKKEVIRQEQKLNELKLELENIDSSAYIKKVAEEQLGMVEEDTIVFREKNK